MKQKLLSTFVLSIMLTYIFAQPTDYSYYGSSVTPKGNLHTLIVFIGFDDATSADDYPNWLHNDLPEWAKGEYNNVFDIDNSQIHTKRNLTSYFYTMSQQTFVMTGEVYPELVIVTPEYLTDGLNISKAIQDAIDKINLQTHPTFNYDWGRFDNRKNGPAYDFDNSLYSNIAGDPAAPDGSIDYICFVIRDEGCAGLSSSSAGTKKLINGTIEYGLGTGHRIDRDCGSGGDAKSLIHVYVHEMMHTVFGSPHTWNVNGVVGNYYYSYNGWGFMAPYTAMECANAWERWWLNWITPQEYRQIQDSILI